MRLHLPTEAGAVAAGVFTATVLLVGACGASTEHAAPPDQPADSPAGPSARAQLTAHAAAAKDLHGIMLYDLVSPDGEQRSVVLVRGADGSWRVDVAGGALGGLADIAVVHTADGLFHCTVAAPDDELLGCVAVPRLTTEVDPRVQRVFTDWLDVMLNRGAPLAVTMADPLDGAEGDCFAVEPSAAALEPPLDAGIYCYRHDGVLTGARLSMGTLTLAGESEGTVAAVELPAPVIDGDPLPLTSPPPPSPSASPSAQASQP